MATVTVNGSSDDNTRSLPLFDAIEHIEPDPPHSGGETSRAAAEEIKPDANKLRRQVLVFLIKCAVMGATDEDMQDGLDMPGNTQRPRRRELVQARLVVDSGYKRYTHSGRKATVWVAKEYAND